MRHLNLLLLFFFYSFAFSYCFLHTSIYLKDWWSFARITLYCCSNSGRKREATARPASSTFDARLFFFAALFMELQSYILCQPSKETESREKVYYYYFLFFLKVFRAFCFPPAAVVFPVRYFAFIYWKSIFFSCVYVTETISEFLCTALSFTSRLLSLSLSP